MNEQRRLFLRGCLVGGVYMTVAPAIIHNAMKIHVPERFHWVDHFKEVLWYNGTARHGINGLIFIDEFRMAPPQVDKAVQQLLRERYERN